MKRYEHFCSADGGGMGEPEETADGDWVRYEDAVAAVAAERERCAGAAWAHYMDTCRRKSISPASAEDWNAAASVRRA